MSAWMPDTPARLRRSAAGKAKARFAGHDVEIDTKYHEVDMPCVM